MHEARLHMVSTLSLFYTVLETRSLANANITDRTIRKLWGWGTEGIG